MKFTNGKWILEETSFSSLDSKRERSTDGIPLTPYGTNDSSNRMHRDNRTVIKYSIRFGSSLGQRWLSFLLSNIYQEFLFRKTVALNRELENARDGGGGGLNF